MLATAQITVTEASAKLTVPMSTASGEHMAISWTGPNRANDYVAIVKPGEKSTHRHIRYRWATKSGKTKIKAPEEPGSYEVIYVLQGSDERRILAREKFVVKAP